MSSIECPSFFLFLVIVTLTHDWALRVFFYIKVNDTCLNNIKFLFPRNTRIQEVPGLFVWHEALQFKLQTYGKGGHLLKWFNSHSLKVIEHKGSCTKSNNYQPYVSMLVFHKGLY